MNTQTEWVVPTMPRGPVRGFDPEEFKQHLLTLQEKTGIELDSNKVQIGRLSMPALIPSFATSINTDTEQPPFVIHGMHFGIPHESGATTRVFIGTTSREENPAFSLITHLGRDQRNNFRSVKHSLNSYESPSNFMSKYGNHINDVEKSLRENGPVDPDEVKFSLSDHKHTLEHTDTVNGVWSNRAKGAPEDEVFGKFIPSRNYEFRRNIR